MRNIKLTDGTVYPVDLCGASYGTLYVNVTEPKDLLALVLVFGQEEKVERIEHWYDGTETDHIFFEGYKHLTSAAITDTGVQMTLKREA